MFPHNLSASARRIKCGSKRPSPVRLLRILPRRIAMRTAAVVLYLSIEIAIGVVFLLLRTAFPQRNIIVPLLVTANGIRFGLAIAWVLAVSPSFEYLSYRQWFTHPIVAAMALVASLIVAYWLYCVYGFDWVIRRLEGLRQNRLSPPRPEPKAAQEFWKGG